jgi:hypothetical protein
MEDDLIFFFEKGRQSQNKLCKQKQLKVKTMVVGCYIGILDQNNL